MVWVGAPSGYRSAGVIVRLAALTLRDRPVEGAEVDRVLVGPAADAGVEGVDRGELVGA